jgi:hypothetical protein
MTALQTALSSRIVRALFDTTASFSRAFLEGVHREPRFGSLGEAQGG